METFEAWYEQELRQIVSRDFSEKGDLEFIHDHKSACRRAWTVALKKERSGG